MHGTYVTRRGDVLEEVDVSEAAGKWRDFGSADDNRLKKPHNLGDDDDTSSQAKPA